MSQTIRQTHSIIQLRAHSNRFYLRSHSLPVANKYTPHKLTRDNRLLLYRGELKRLDYLLVPDLLFSPSITSKHRNQANHESKHDKIYYVDNNNSAQQLIFPTQFIHTAIRESKHTTANVAKSIL